MAWTRRAVGFSKVAGGRRAQEMLPQPKRASWAAGGSAACHQRHAGYSRLSVDADSAETAGARVPQHQGFATEAVMVKCRKHSLRDNQRPEAVRLAEGGDRCQAVQPAGDATQAQREGRRALPRACGCRLYFEMRFSYMLMQ